MADQRQILEAIADSLGLQTADVDLDSSFQDDLGLNPVEVADLLHDLSGRFSIVFLPLETEQLKTVNDLVEVIEDKLLE